MKRRDFFSRAGGLTAPLLFPVGLQAIGSSLPKSEPAAVNFYSDSPQLSVPELLGTLQALVEKDGIQVDSYGNGGAVQTLEERMASLTGKEKAIYLPTGTMANQLAIKLLSGDNTKVFVQEKSSGLIWPKNMKSSSGAPIPKDDSG